MPDPKSHARAALLAGAMAFEPPMVEPFTMAAVPIRRVLPQVTPPLDLSVIPFRYRVREGRIEPVRPRCGHGHRRPDARGHKKRIPTE